MSLVIGVLLPYLFSLWNHESLSCSKLELLYNYMLHYPLNSIQLVQYLMCVHVFYALQPKIFCLNNYNKLTNKYANVYNHDLPYQNLTLNLPWSCEDNE